MIIAGFKNPGGQGTADKALFKLFLFFLLVFQFQQAFPDLPAYKFLKIYPRDQYSGQIQNWSILQDKRGIIYVGNQGCLLEFDGVSWRRIEIPNNSVRGLAMDPLTGTIYVGGMGTFGVLDPGPGGKGELQYRSLLTGLPEQERNVNLVVRIHTLDEAVYFRSKSHLIRKKEGLEILEKRENNSLKGSFVCNGKLYIREHGVGLLRLQGDRLIPVTGGEQFADKKIFMMAPYPGENILINTRNYGFFLYNETNGATPFIPKDHNYISQNQLSRGIRLESGNYALGTKKGGLLIMDRAGNTWDIFSEKNGLPENIIRQVYEDMEGNIWLAHDWNITRIEYNSPISC